jgi:hypothetical protein
MDFVTDLLHMAKNGGLLRGHYLNEDEELIFWHKNVYRYHVNTILTKDALISKRIESCIWLLDDNTDPSVPFSMAAYAYLSLEEVRQEIIRVMKSIGLFEQLKQAKQTPAVIKTARRVGIVLKYDDKSQSRTAEEYARATGSTLTQAKRITTMTINKDIKGRNHGQLDFFELDRRKAGLREQHINHSKGENK